MSDASHCPKTRSSGYGVWCKSDRGSFQCGGNFKGWVKHSQEAEAKGLSIAVWAAFYNGVAEIGDHLIIQTDNLGNVNAFDKPNTLPNNHRAIEPLQWVKNIISENKCTYDIRHVKAHNPSLGKRNYINHVCDKLARKAMEDQRGY
tara:strand:- start:562 stop:999 length:438 start_codon:yes stop_codon:yes gene_type:complete